MPVEQAVPGKMRDPTMRRAHLENFLSFGARLFIHPNSLCLMTF